MVDNVAGDDVEPKRLKMKLPVRLPAKVPAMSNQPLM